MVFIKETNCSATIMYVNVKETNGDFAADVEPFPLCTMKAHSKADGLCALNASFQLLKNPEELR